MELYEAIFKRRSTRKYSDERLDIKVLEQIKGIINNAERLYKDIDLQIHLVEEGGSVTKIMKGLIGNIGKITAPHFLVVTSEKKEGYMENAGFTVENIVLALTSMGIATCWLGGHIDNGDLRTILSLNENQHSVVLISLGYPQQKDSVYRENLKTIKRKNINEFVSGQIEEGWMEILEAVRVAPSAVNVQPWRLVFEKEAIHVYVETPSNFIMKKLLGNISVLDVGIALSHVKIAAKHNSKAISFRRVDGKVVKEQKYITSIYKS